MCVRDKVELCECSMGTAAAAVSSVCMQQSQQRMELFGSEKREMEIKKLSSWQSGSSKALRGGRDSG